MRVKIVSLEDTMEKEMATLNDDVLRNNLLLEVNNEISKVIEEIQYIQSLLINLKIAFDNFQPLPPHIELRVSNDSGRPYWVDHLHHSTSYEPPIESIISYKQQTDVRCQINQSLLLSLPEFKLHSHSMTLLINKLDILYLKYQRIVTFNLFKDDNQYTQLNKELEGLVIDEAHIVFTTLNSCGLGAFDNTKFCVTVIDEAAQCVEPSVLIALRRGCEQCIMVGDQKQLPATVFSNRLKGIGYDKPLFERLIDGGVVPIMLDTQYRMHPDISLFPSSQFYFGKLLNASIVEVQSYLPKFISPLNDNNIDNDNNSSSNNVSNDNDNSNNKMT